MKRDRPIFLVGFMGSGKSTFGRRLAEILQLSFEDTDESISRTAQKSIPQIFNRFGENYFRVLERNHFLLVNCKAAVIATGGGYPMYFNSMTELQSKGLVIFIDTNWDICFERIQADLLFSRPLAKNENDLKRLFDLRLELYSKANLRFDPKAESLAELSSKILAINS